jgi:hypothetical protein
MVATKYSLPLHNRKHGVVDLHVSRVILTGSTADAVYEAQGRAQYDK